MGEDRGGVRKISDFIVGELSCLPALVAPGPAIPQSGGRLEISLSIRVQHVFINTISSVRARDVAGVFGCRWLYK